MPLVRSSLSHNLCVGSMPYIRKVAPWDSSRPRPFGESRAANVDLSKSLYSSTYSGATALPASSLKGVFMSTEPKDWPDFPTRAQYAKIESAYLNGLASFRREKALISRTLFNRICEVLRSQEDTDESAQFRHWARKRFVMGKADVVSLVPSSGPGYNFGSNSAREQGVDSNNFEVVERDVLLNKGLLVVVKEQIYDLLCFCHGSVNHAGRDKTCAWLRKSYTWVPRELVVQFIKACPTCIKKRSRCVENEALPAPTAASMLIPPLRFPEGKETSPKEGMDNPHHTPYEFFIDSIAQRKPGPEEPLSISQSVSPNNSPTDTDYQFIFNTTPLDDSIDIPRDASQLDAGLTLLDLSCADVPATSRIPNPLSLVFPDTSFCPGDQNGLPYVSETDYIQGYARPSVSQRVASILAYDKALSRSEARVPGTRSLAGVDFDVDMDRAIEKLFFRTDVSSPFADGLGTFSPKATPKSIPLQWLDEERAIFGSPINALSQSSMPIQSTVPESGAATYRYISPILRGYKTAVHPFVTPGVGSTGGTISDIEDPYETNFPASVDIEKQKQGAREAGYMFGIIPSMGQSPASDSSAATTPLGTPISSDQEAILPPGVVKGKGPVADVIGLGVTF